MPISMFLKVNVQRLGSYQMLSRLNFLSIPVESQVCGCLTSVYTAHIDIFAPWQAKALQSVKHVDVCRIHRETNVAWWHGLREVHRDDYAHNIAWIYTYNNCLELIPILQGQELLWLERVTYIAIRVHHTKYIVTHTHAGRHRYTYIMDNAITQSGKENHTLPAIQGYGPARYRKVK